jgi:hypothetical protein
LSGWFERCVQRFAAARLRYETLGAVRCPGERREVVVEPEVQEPRDDDRHVGVGDPAVAESAKVVPRTIRAVAGPTRTCTIIVERSASRLLRS